VTEFSSIDFSASGASDEHIQQAWQILATEGVLLASGRRKRVKEFGDIGKAFAITQLYLPIPKSSNQCEDGYEYYGGYCRTPFGCDFPQLELTTVGGAAQIDPITGEIISSESKSCVDQCEFPAVSNGPGRCFLALP
jgi:hypothetical protein